MNRAELVDPITWRLRPLPPDVKGSAFRADPAAQRAADQRLSNQVRRGECDGALRIHSAAPVVWRPMLDPRQSVPRHQANARREADTPTRRINTAELVACVRRLARPGGISNGEIAGALGVPSFATGSYLSRLVRAGTLRRTGARHHYRYSPAD